MSAYTISVEDQPLVANAPQTVLQVTAGVKRVAIIEWGISFSGTSAADAPVKVEMRRQTTAGTASAATIVKLQEGDPAPLLTASIVFTVEPTYGDLMFPYRLTPNGGLWVIQYPLGREPWVSVGDRFALVCTAAVAVPATAYMIVEE